MLAGMDLAEQAQHAAAVAAAVGVLLAGWWSGTQTPEPPDTTDALRVQE